MGKNNCKHLKNKINLMKLSGTPRVTLTAFEWLPTYCWL